MSRKKHKSKSQKQHRDKRQPQMPPQLELELHKKENHLEIVIIVLLICYGIYHSVLYFGHQAVPNPDFTAFVHTGKEILSFRIPSSFKRAPVLGMLQTCLSWFVTGQHPELTAGWLLNAILHPLNLVLLYLVGKKIIGKAALWAALIYIINPWTISSLLQPIAETTLLFFTLLTFYLIFRRSKWCYLAASLTSMVRYEGAALILAAFIMDMIYEKNSKSRIKSFLYSALASVPLMLWILGTLLSLKQAGGTHYLKELGARGAFVETTSKYLKMIWQTGFYPLLFSPFKTKENAELVFSLSRFVVVISFCFGTVYGFVKRKWEILALLIFLVPYLLVHIIHSNVLPRFCIIICWIILFMCIFGLQSAWGLLNKDNKIPKPIIVFLQVVVTAIALFWLYPVYEYVTHTERLSSRSVSIPYVGTAVIILLFAAKRFFTGKSQIRQEAVIVILMCLMTFCNQAVLVRAVGNGTGDIEFKYLADWYVKNARPGEKLASTMPNLLRIFAPKYESNFARTPAAKAQSPDDFVKICYEKNITYLAWDSRLGLTPANRYYKLWGLKNVAMLAQPQNVGPFEFIDQIKVNNRQFINIFRLRKPQPIPRSVQKDPPANQQQ